VLWRIVLFAPRLTLTANSLLSYSVLLFCHDAVYSVQAKAGKVNKVTTQRTCRCSWSYTGNACYRISL